MSQRYRTKEGDVLDRVCWKHYGAQAGAVEAVLEANTNLAEHGYTGFQSDCRYSRYHKCHPARLVISARNG